MNYDFSGLKEKVKETKEWLSKELVTIRTGRATPAILDSVTVLNYGAKSPLNQVAGINIEDARTLRIAPWNPDQIKDIENAVTDAGLGLSVAVDEKGVRVTFPELTSERRNSLIKLAKEKVEKAKVSIRGERDKVWSDIQKKQQNGELSEDEKFTLKEKMQKIIDEVMKNLDESGKRKEAEISA